MSIITLNNLSKSYGGKLLFKNLNLTINRREKIGLIGPNGTGKSTLFSLILKKLEACTGQVQINKTTHIGYLPQEANFKSKVSVLSELLRGDENIMRLKKEKEELEKENKCACERYAEIMHDLEFFGYFELEHKAKKILAGLGFKEKGFQRPVNELSGGWKMRTLLAKLLTCRYDILLLDEPMNHLDLNAAMWFKNYLRNFKEAFIIISHDKAFLNEVTNYTLVLENAAITKIKGNYEHYEKVKDERYTFLLKQFKEQEKKRKQLEFFIRRFHAQPNKASQVRAKKKSLEKMQKVVVPQNRRESIRKFHFPKARRSGYNAVRLNNISKAYGDIKVYRNFNFEITHGEKAVLAGENGAGKSTLLKILAGIIDIDAGTRTIGHNVDIGYFSQDRMDMLNPYNTVFEEAYSASKGNLSGEDIRTILGAFLFTADEVEKKVTVLSGGEKSRLILAKLLINPPNLLLLDEPTTHLDVDAVDALIKALTEYEGTIVFISHDIHFVKCAANTVFEVKEGNVRKFAGDFDYYWQKQAHSATSAVLSSKAKKEVKEHSFTPRAHGYTHRRIDEKERKEHNAKLANEIKFLRKERERLELELCAKKRTLSNPHSFHREDTIKEYNLRINEIEKRLIRIKEETLKFKKAFI